MQVALVHDAVLPVVGYGGTERVISWLLRGLHEIGVETTLIAKPGSRNTFGKLIEHTGKFPPSQFPRCDLVHFFNTPSFVPGFPYLVSIHGNGKPQERFLPNTSFVSRNHALRHGAEAYVYNGIDPDEYRFEKNKDGSLLFLAKASWKVKNVKGAIRIARKAERALHIVGGKRWFFPHWRGIHWEGILDGEKKTGFLSRCSALLFPVLWEEPFGLAVVEALASGTPVLATKRGSLPELVTAEVGALCETDDEFLSAIEKISTFDPKQCREAVMARFHYRNMARSYLALYEKILSGEKINQNLGVQAGR